MNLEDKILFYELLAHHLTVANRIFWSNDKTSDQLKISQMKWLNEILHRITAKSRVERLQLHEWKESSIIEMIIRYVKQEPSIGPEIAWSITKAYEVVASKGN